jgi:hypothetical protein
MNLTHHSQHLYTHVTIDCGTNRSVRQKIPYRIGEQINVLTTINIKVIIGNFS